MSVDAARRLPLNIVRVEFIEYQRVFSQHAFYTNHAGFFGSGGGVLYSPFSPVDVRVRNEPIKYFRTYESPRWELREFQRHVRERERTVDMLSKVLVYFLNRDLLSLSLSNSNSVADWMASSFDGTIPEWNFKTSFGGSWKTANANEKRTISMFMHAHLSYLTNELPLCTLMTYLYTLFAVFAVCYLSC